MKHSITFILLTALTLGLIPPVPAASQAPACGYSSAIAGLLGQSSQAGWTNWTGALAGEFAVPVGTGSATFTTRNTRAMFSQPALSLAFQYTQEQAANWAPAGQLATQGFHINGSSGLLLARNLILTQPGQVSASERVILSAHLDSYAGSSASAPAPGADDNAAGAAALLEAARLLRHYRFERTIQLIWFTGEEQGLLGSEAYVASLPAGVTVSGNINLDMFSYDPNNDGCFQLHVGTLAKSAEVGQCVSDTIQAYNLNLPHQILTSEATWSSDHASFWSGGMGAVEISEVFQAGSPLPAGCLDFEENPFYHTFKDKLPAMNAESGFKISRAAIAAAANLAGPLGTCFDGSTPQDVSLDLQNGKVTLGWQALPGSSAYRVYRSETGCSGTDWRSLGETSALSFKDLAALPGKSYAYQVEAVGSDLSCYSLPSACVETAVPWLPIYLPVVR